VAQGDSIRDKRKGETHPKNVHPPGVGPASSQNESIGQDHANQACNHGQNTDYSDDNNSEGGAM
jgi:hypothetical protein